MVIDKQVSIRYHTTLAMQPQSSSPQFLARSSLMQPPSPQTLPQLFFISQQSPQMLPKLKPTSSTECSAVRLASLEQLEKVPLEQCLNQLEPMVMMEATGFFLTRALALSLGFLGYSIVQFLILYFCPAWLRQVWLAPILPASPKSGYFSKVYSPLLVANTRLLITDPPPQAAFLLSAAMELAEEQSVRCCGERGPVVGLARILSMSMRSVVTQAQELRHNPWALTEVFMQLRRSSRYRP